MSLLSSDESRLNAFDAPDALIEAVNVEFSSPEKTHLDKQGLVGESRRSWKKTVLVSGYLLAITAMNIALLILWLTHTTKLAVTATMDPSGLPDCQYSAQLEFGYSQLPCRKSLNETVIVVTDWRRLSHVSLYDSTSGLSSLVAAPTPDASLAIRRVGLYQLNVQVTFADPEFADNAAFFLLSNGREFAQCHTHLRAAIAGAELTTCTLTFVRQFAAGDKVDWRVDPMLAVVADPAMTFLSLSSLSGSHCM